MATAWGAPSSNLAWAEQVEEEEAQNGVPLLDEAYPTLGESVKQAKEAPPKKKKQQQKMSFSEFMGVPGGARGGSSRTSEKEILMQLPKGSSGVKPEEREPGSLGGGFREYGGQRGGGGGGKYNHHLLAPQVETVVLLLPPLQPTILLRSATYIAYYVCSCIISNCAFKLVTS